MYSKHHTDHFVLLLFLFIDVIIIFVKQFY